MPQASPKQSFDAKMQQAFQDAWAQAATQWGHAMPFANTFTKDGNTSGAAPFADMLGAAGLGGGLRIDPTRLQQLQQQYMEEISELWKTPTKPAGIDKDRRFASEWWQKQPLSGFAAALHLANSRLMFGMAEALEGEPQTCGRVRFAVEQWAAAAAPSNFLPFNADAVQKAVETQGESIARGLQNLLSDVQKGHVSMTDESLFEVGKNVGTSEGAVVFENEIFQLIEYKPLTDKVHERPFLMVPACINKFYILDLQPDNSVVRFAVEQGHHTFIMSWRNPDASMSQVTWDDTIEKGVITAIEKVLEISGAKKVNTLGFCVGGTLLATALAVLAARKKPIVNSATFLTCLLDFSNPGVLGLFIDEAFVRYREMQFSKGGILPSGDLLNTFSFLRPNDLVWNYVVGNYLKGETPPPFDLLYWNCDSTNLPGPWYAWYLRNAYQENLLKEPGKTTVCGTPVDFGRINIPVYLYGSREDHIVPIEGAYASTQILPGDKRFVMGASGHIAGVINPLKKNKRSYWTNDDLPATHAEWLEGATENLGSWWGDWKDWLAKQGGRKVAPPKGFGNAKNKVIEAAPGRYVKAKAKAV